jgi:hypothetical protein
MLSGIQRAGDLEIPEDLDFQRKVWALQRHGWAAMGVLVLLGLLGAFGSGPFSDAMAGDAGSPLVLRYQRFARFRSPSQLVAELRPGTASLEARLWLSSDFLASVQIEDIEPQPVRVEAGPDRSAYVIRLAAPKAATRVTISVRPDAAGRISGRASLDDSRPLRFAQFVYP